MLTNYRHLATQDRIEIEKLLDSGHSQTMIAQKVGCHRSTISREIRRRSWSPERAHANLRPYLRNKLNTMGVPTYFCDPYSSFQRGTNEHFNGRVRRYLPKGTSFHDVTQEELDEYITEINNRPRKVLGWLTPAEVFQELCSKETIT